MLSYQVPSCNIPKTRLEMELKGFKMENMHLHDQKSGGGQVEHLFVIPFILVRILWREEREPVELPASSCWLAAKFRPSSLVALLSALCFPLENNEAILRVARGRASWRVVVPGAQSFVECCVCRWESLSQRADGSRGFQWIVGGREWR